LSVRASPLTLPGQADDGSAPQLRRTHCFRERSNRSILHYVVGRSRVVIMTKDWFRQKDFQQPGVFSCDLV